MIGILTVKECAVNRTDEDQAANKDCGGTQYLLESVVEGAIVVAVDLKVSAGRNVGESSPVALAPVSSCLGFDFSPKSSGFRVRERHG